jgi:DNA-binding NtrC family response regulator
VRRFIGQHLFSFLAAPADPQHVALALRQAWGMASVRAAHYTLPPHESMIGKSAGMQRMFDQIGRVARTDAPVLINGASGTGKEMVAQSIHRMSHRRDAPFVAINCGAIATHLFQSELFGHEKGAFTGAHQRRIGRIELAKGGTLFLDEIGDMPFDMQVNLLRFLQEKTIERVGGTATLAIDVRIIAATNVDLADAVRRGSFREDLYYRINVVCLQTPPLAERGEDIAELAHHFLVRFATAPNAGPRGFSAAAMDAMMRHPWPGNVRELMNRVQRAVVMAEGRLIQPADLDLACHTTVAPPIMSLEATRSAAEREIVLRALALASNRISHAANLLGVARLTLYRLIEKHGISLAGRPVPKIKPRRVEKEEA